MKWPTFTRDKRRTDGPRAAESSGSNGVGESADPNTNGQRGAAVAADRSGGGVSADRNAEYQAQPPQSSQGSNRISLLTEEVEEARIAARQAKSGLESLRGEIERLREDLAELRERSVGERTDAALSSAWSRLLTEKHGLRGVAPGMCPEEWALVAAANLRIAEPDLPHAATLSFLEEFGMNADLVAFEPAGPDRLRARDGRSAQNALAWLICRSEAQDAEYLVPLKLGGVSEEDRKALSIAFRGAEDASDSCEARVFRACRIAIAKSGEAAYEIVQKGTLASPSPYDASSLQPPLWLGPTGEQPVQGLSSVERAVETIAEPPVRTTAGSGPQGSLPAMDGPTSRALEERLERLEGTWQDAIPEARALQQAVADLQSEASDRLRDRPEDKVATLSQAVLPRLDAQAADLGHVQARLVSVESRTDFIGTRLDAVDSRFASIEARLDVMFNALEAARADLASSRSEPSTAPRAKGRVARRETAEALPANVGQPAPAPAASQLQGPDPDFPQVPAGWRSVLDRCGNVPFSGPAGADEVDAYHHRLEMLRAGLDGAGGAGPQGFRVRLAHLYAKKGSTFLLHGLVDAPGGGSMLQCRDCGDLRHLAFQVFVVVERQGKSEVAVLLPLAQYLFGRYARGVQMLIDEAPDTTETVTEIVEPAILAPGGQSEYAVRRKMKIVTAGATPSR